MGHIIVPNAVKRKQGYLYYIDGEGNLWETELNHKGGFKGRQWKQKRKKTQ